MKNNWRGKTRPDKLQSTTVIDILCNGEIEEKKKKEEEEEEGEEEEEAWNEQALKMAVKRGMSMWRSHTGMCCNFVYFTALSAVWIV